MANLTAQDSLNIMDAVDLLNEMDATGASIWGMQHLEKIPEHRRDLLLKELSKGKHKNLFNKPIETAQDTTNLSNAIVSKGGTMSTYAPSDKYQEAKLKFNNAVSEMNKVALGLQVVKDDYDAESKLYAGNEERMNILVEDEYKDYPPALFTLGFGKKHAFGEVVNKNPELYKNLKDSKATMKSLDAKLGYLNHGMPGQSNDVRNTYRNAPREEKPLYLQYGEAKGDIFKALKELNIFEGNSSKTVLPEEFLNNTGYNTLTLEEE